MRKWTLVSLLLATGILQAAEHWELDINASQVWTDTGIYLRPGDSVVMNATGLIHFDSDRECGPEGLPRAWGDVTAAYPLQVWGRGTLIGRLTNDAAARPFAVAGHIQRITPVNGRLFLGINEAANKAGQGSFHVAIDVTRGNGATPNQGAYVPRLDQGMLDSLPVQANDAQGNPSNRVNFIIVGSPEHLSAALRAAGWQPVSKSKKDAIMHDLEESLSNKEASTTMPLSPLFLFDRPQDFGYAQADPLKAMESLHNFRLWRCPFTLNGLDVWAGAGTHDIGFERDRSKGLIGVARKVDPKTDGERDFIGQSLGDAGMVADEEYMFPTYPATSGKFVNGGGFTSDGRTLVIYLKP